MGLVRFTYPTGETVWILPRLPTGSVSFKSVVHGGRVPSDRRTRQTLPKKIPDFHPARIGPTTSQPTHNAHFKALNNKGLCPKDSFSSANLAPRRRSRSLRLREIFKKKPGSL